MKKLAGVRVSGPLGEYAAGLVEALGSEGYAHSSVVDDLRLAGHLSRWLAERAIAPTEVTKEVVEQFVAERRRTSTARGATRGLAPLLRYLRTIGVVPAAPQEASLGSEVLCAYDRYLAEERVVKPLRRRYYVEVAGQLLAKREAADLLAADVTRDVRAHAGQADLPARLTALRSVLSFLFLRGHAPLNLVHAVPSASGRRLVSLPKDLDKAEVQAVLASCDRRTTLGRRNYAALLLMVRLGLRVGEVAALKLDDIDWEAGEIVVHGKGGSAGRLPLSMIT